MRLCWIAGIIALLQLACPPHVLASLNRDVTSLNEPSDPRLARRVRSRDLPPHVVRYIGWIRAHNPEFLISALIALQKALDLQAINDRKTSQRIAKPSKEGDDTARDNAFTELDKRRLPLRTDPEHDPGEWHKKAPTVQRILILLLPVHIRYTIM